MEFQFGVQSFVPVVTLHKVLKPQKEISFCSLFVLFSFLSFHRLVALNRAPKRRNEVSLRRLFVLATSTSTRRQNEQTTERLDGTWWPFRFFFLLTSSRHQNDEKK